MATDRNFINRPHNRTDQVGNSGSAAEITGHGSGGSEDGILRNGQKDQKSRLDSGLDCALEMRSVRGGAPAFDVLVVGELNVDLILDGLQQPPEMGKEVFAGQMTYTLGSSSAIFAANLSATGTKVAFAGKTGADDFGRKIRLDLEAKKVHTAMIRSTNNAATGITVALNNGDDRSMITYPGAMALLTAEDITDEMLLKASHLHVSSIFMQEGLTAGIAGLFKRARHLGLSTSLDPQWDPAQKWAIDLKQLLPQVSIFLPNINELLAMTHTDSKEAAISKIGAYLEMMVVKDGRSGAHAWFNDKWTHQPAFLNNQVVDAIGAGDSFNAGFISDFLRNRPLHKCLQQAAFMGAINTTAAGGTAAFTNFVPHRKIQPQKYNLYTHEATA